MPAPPRTTQLLDDLDDHIDAANAASDEILADIADGIITSVEGPRIVASLRRLTDTLAPIPVHAARLDGAIRDARSLLHCGEWTPKLQRNHRERQTDLARIEAGALLRFPEMPLDAA